VAADDLASVAKSPRELGFGLGFLADAAQRAFGMKLRPVLVGAHVVVGRRQPARVVVLVDVVLVVEVVLVPGGVVEVSSGAPANSIERRSSAEFPSSSVTVAVTSNDVTPAS
jgi:hypothetical protein